MISCNVSACPVHTIYANRNYVQASRYPCRLICEADCKITEFRHKYHTYRNSSYHFRHSWEYSKSRISKALRTHSASVEYTERPIEKACVEKIFGWSSKHCCVWLIHKDKRKLSAEEYKYNTGYYSICHANANSNAYTLFDTLEISCTEILACKNRCTCCKSVIRTHCELLYPCPSSESWHINASKLVVSRLHDHWADSRYGILKSHRKTHYYKVQHRRLWHRSVLFWKLKHVYLFHNKYST